LPEPVGVELGMEAVLAAIAVLPGPQTVLIDGPSGSGKSTFADLLLPRWPSTGVEPLLVRLDDIYPGWSGLEAASGMLVRDVLAPRLDGRDGRWQRWDWRRDHGAEWHVVPAGRPLVVEGCGSLSAAAATLGDVRVWIQANEAIRKSRALERDSGAFDDHWDAWDEQWLGFVRREHPAQQADLVIDAG
jgi:uridine kinase